MHKHPILTDFPRTVFATAKRKAQAAIQTLRGKLIKDKLSGYAPLSQDVLPGDFLGAHAPGRRRRHFPATMVFWAWLAQILYGNASCNKALSLVQAWCRALRLPVPGSDTSVYYQARGRITDNFLEGIDLRVEQHLSQRIEPRDLWPGHALKAVDGTSVTLLEADT